MCSPELDAQLRGQRAQLEMLTHQLVETRMLNLLLQAQHVDDERRMHALGIERRTVSL